MPIRPENRDRYPADWPAISRRIRFERAAGRCPLTAREGPYLLTCCLPAGHDGDCWCNNIQTIEED